ncbi:hypothetical protein V1514DRAFT_328563 [Lipomyces japonicus]|uniref:uncharacterized protein n=1 Tax=Lipomyces japonicus TaxID=56871 RepID=UPI0034D00567
MYDRARGVNISPVKTPYTAKFGSASAHGSTYKPSTPGSGFRWYDKHGTPSTSFGRSHGRQQQRQQQQQQQPGTPTPKTNPRATPKYNTKLYTDYYTESPRKTSAYAHTKFTGSLPKRAPTARKDSENLTGTRPTADAANDKTAMKSNAYSKANRPPTPASPKKSDTPTTTQSANNTNVKENKQNNDEKLKHKEGHGTKSSSSPTPTSTRTQQVEIDDVDTDEEEYLTRDRSVPFMEKINFASTKQANTSLPRQSPQPQPHQQNRHLDDEDETEDEAVATTLNAKLKNRSPQRNIARARMRSQHALKNSKVFDDLGLFRTVPPFTQGNGEFKLSELGEQYPFNSRAEPTRPLESDVPMRSPRSHMPTMPLHATAPYNNINNPTVSDQHLPFDRTAPILPNLDQQTSFEQQPVAATATQQSATVNPSAIDYHDSAVVFDIQSPVPPLVPQNSVNPTAEELSAYWQRVIAYQEQWNDYNLKMTLYFSERGTADRENCLAILLNLDNLDKYVSVLKQDEKVRARWNEALKAHKHVMISLATIKRIVEDR